MNKVHAEPLLGIPAHLPHSIYLPVNPSGPSYFEVRIPGSDFLAIVCYVDESDATDAVKRAGNEKWELRQISFDQVRLAAKERGIPVNGVAVVKETGVPLFHYVA